MYKLLRILKKGFSYS